MRNYSQGEKMINDPNINLNGNSNLAIARRKVRNILSDFEIIKKSKCENRSKIVRVRMLLHEVSELFTDQCGEHDKITMPAREPMVNYLVFMGAQNYE